MKNNTWGKYGWKKYAIATLISDWIELKAKKMSIDKILSYMLGTKHQIDW